MYFVSLLIFSQLLVYCVVVRAPAFPPNPCNSPVCAAVFYSSQSLAFLCRGFRFRSLVLETDSVFGVSKIQELCALDPVCLWRTDTTGASGLQ